MPTARRARRARHQPTSEMPDLRRLATHERVAAMTSWLRARGLVVEDAASAQRAWHAERKKINKADHRERERAAVEGPGREELLEARGLHVRPELLHVAQYGPRGGKALHPRGEAAGP